MAQIRLTYIDSPESPSYHPNLNLNKSKARLVTLTIDQSDAHLNQVSRSFLRGFNGPYIINVRIANPYDEYSDVMRCCIGDCYCSVTYGDRSWSVGYYATETFWFESGDLNVNGGFAVFPKMKFGCGKGSTMSFSSPMGPSGCWGWGGARIPHWPSGTAS
ncbi:hypothetical protein AMTR_s00057p00099850 [Amborella trichopoda]|uniref:Uncharacterized protein n=1 Tax=Amborella trichopoda TaxID=13333 RepID=U5D3I9_AMBTC|nr:hypothetical protein AMTR_s00057p00099850 [Amborella trichopoda]